MWKYVTTSVIGGSLIYGLYRYFSGGVCHCTGRLDGLIIVITGANTGIGKALALELALRGATLVLACRDIERGINAKKFIVSKLKDKQTPIYVKQLDLASFTSIIKFSNELKTQFDEIYALVNNAAIFYHPHQVTEDDYEITFQVNYLGHFVLTHHLLVLLKQSDDARIINVVSEAHRFVNAYDLKAITTCQTEFRSHFTAYGVSKLSQILFTKYLSKHLSNTNIIVNAVNPGNVETDLYRYFPLLNNKILYAIQWPIRLIIVKNPKQGAQTILHCLLTTNRSTGQYYNNCRMKLASPLASDDKVAKDYYNLTLEILADKFTTESYC